MPVLRKIFLPALIGAVLVTTMYLMYNHFIKESLLDKQTVQPGSTAESFTAGTAAASESISGNTQASVKEDSEQQADTGENKSNTESTDEDALHIMEPHAAGNFELENSSGKKVKLSDYKGKPVIISFWAAWSPYCIEEMPELQKLGDSLKESKKAVLLTINSGEDKKLVTDFIKSNSLTFSVLLDMKEAVSESYGVPGIPFTLFIKSDGTVYGYIDKAVNSQTVLEIIDNMK